jgi:hypothetical protein
MNEILSKPDDDGDRASVRWSSGPGVAIVAVHGADMGYREAAVDLEDAKAIRDRLSELIDEHEAQLAAKIKRGDKVRGTATGRLYVAISDEAPNQFGYNPEVELVVLDSLNENLVGAIRTEPTRFLRKVSE